jgi:NADPH-dependent 2,4-dienoyl-CoA reductase/sulfur reductase-like enzyme
MPFSESENGANAVCQHSTVPVLRIIRLFRCHSPVLNVTSRPTCCYAGITYKTSTKATALDVAGKHVTLAGGDTVSYDKLILATGAKVITRKGPSVPPLDWFLPCIKV